MASRSCRSAQPESTCSISSPSPIAAALAARSFLTRERSPHAVISSASTEAKHTTIYLFISYNFMIQYSHSEIRKKFSKADYEMRLSSRTIIFLACSRALSLRMISCWPDSVEDCSF